jgi:hypothetical protein
MKADLTVWVLRPASSAIAQEILTSSRLPDLVDRTALHA